MRNLIHVQVGNEGNDFIVTSRLRGFFHLANSITVADLDLPCLFSDDFPTVTHFLATYDPALFTVLDQRQVPVPFLRAPLGLGDAIAVVAERLPRAAKWLFHGCADRRRWLNLTILLVPRAH